MAAEPPPLANTFTLGVHDVQMERDFYCRLGWPIVLDSDDFVVFELRGTLLALFRLDNLAADARTPPDRHRDGIRCAITIRVDDPSDVDGLASQVQEAGGTMTKEPTDGEFIESRDAHFRDPEGNNWEIAWAAPDNPVVVAARRAAGLS